MAFKIGSFAAGFANAAVDDLRTKQDDIRDLVKVTYTSDLAEARAIRKQRKAERRGLEQLGARLQREGFTEAQAASLLGQGIEGAEQTLGLVQEARVHNKTFDLAAFYTIVEDPKNNISLKDAINRTMGELRGGSGKKAMPSLGAGGKTLLGGDMSKFTQSQFDLYSAAGGEDYGSIRDEVSGEYEYGNIPVGEIDRTMLAFETPLDETQRQAAQAAINKINTEIEDLKAKRGTLSATEQSRVISYVNTNMASRVKDLFGIGISFDDEGKMIATEGTKSKDLAKAGEFIGQMHAAAIAKVSSDLNFRNNVALLSEWVDKEWIPEYQANKKAELSQANKGGSGATLSPEEISIQQNADDADNALSKHIVAIKNSTDDDSIISAARDMLNSKIITNEPNKNKRFDYKKQITKLIREKLTAQYEAAGTPLTKELSILIRRRANELYDKASVQNAGDVVSDLAGGA